jgi:hypothetical protein
MRQKYGWLIDAVSGMLEPEEREVVLGDCAESSETRGRALLGVLGLVLRRQAALWAGWRPWLALVGLIIPLGMLLSIVSMSTANGSAVYVWLYANNWDLALMRNPGFWRLLAETAAMVSVWYLTLACCSWTSGLLLGSVSRGMFQTSGMLLCLMLLFGELVGAPRYFAFCQDYLQRTFRLPPLPDYNAAVFDLTFYRVMFPLVVQAFLVALPALWGLAQGLGVAGFRLRFRIAFSLAAVLTLSAMVMGNRAFWPWLINTHIVNAHREPGSWLGWGMRLFQFLVFWPVAYVVVSAIRHRPARQDGGSF